MGKWLKRLGIASVFAFPIAVLMYRTGIAPFHTGFALIQIGGFGGALIFLIGLVYYFVARNSNPEGAKAGLVGALIALIPVLPLAVQAHKAKTLPYIHNVSTDVVNAPAFDKVVALRADDDNPHQYDPNRTIGDLGTLAELQTKGYPHIKTLESNLSVAEALSKAEELVKSRGWELVNLDVDKGILEATETTFLWGFKDDIVIRITKGNDKTLVDMRSVSRFGGSDLGVNAARIEAFLSDFAN